MPLPTITLVSFTVVPMPPDPNEPDHVRHAIYALDLDGRLWRGNEARFDKTRYEYTWEWEQVPLPIKTRATR